MRNRDDRPWREHQTHVPREFDQASRRADFRARGAHETDEERHGPDPRWPGPDSGSRGPQAPAAADSSARIGRQGYPAADGPPRRRRGAPQVVSRAGDAALPRNRSPEHGAGERLAATSGYDDYEAEMLYGSQFQEGDWPSTFRRGARGSTARSQRPDHRGKGPQGYQRSDERLLEDVHQRLTDDAYLDARRLSVSVDQGMVVLEGTVPQRWMKHHAEHVAARCYGVADVDNRIRVKSS